MEKGYMNRVEKKIDLNKIIEEMYQKFGKDCLTELEKARYLYIELGKLLRFDKNYDTASRYKFEDTYYKTIDFDDIKTNEYVCRQMSEMYTEILKRVGIDAETIEIEGGKPNYEFKHKYTSIKLKDGRKIIADLTYDLPYIQQGLKSQNFGTNTEWGHDTISEDEIKEIDDKIRYTYPNKEGHRDYTEYFLDMLSEEMKKEENIKDFLRGTYSEEESKKYNPDLLIKYKFDIISRFFSLENMGFKEGKKFLNILYRHFFTLEERQNIGLRVLHSEINEDGRIGKTDEMLYYCYGIDKNNLEYYVYEEGKNLVKISKANLIQKVAQKKYTAIVKSEMKHRYYDGIIPE